MKGERVQVNDRYIRPDGFLFFWLFFNVTIDPGGFEWFTWSIGEDGRHDGDGQPQSQVSGRGSPLHPPFVRPPRPTLHSKMATGHAGAAVFKGASFVFFVCF